MFGYLRFFLALLVLLSHGRLRLGWGFNPGVFAVVMFYMLAGFVSAHLFEKIFTENRQTISFYLDRILRIYPQYLFIALLSLCFLVVTQYSDPEYGTQPLLNNLLIIPLSYYKTIDSSILQSPPQPLIPPAWSLGLELQAYILLPFAIRSVAVRSILGSASFFIFFIANLGIISPEEYGYRLIVGVFFIFILGISIHHRLRESSHLHRFDRIFPGIVLVTLTGLLAILLASSGMMLDKFIRETILGVIFGITLLFLLGRQSKKIPGNRLLGDLSYGVFLSHFLAMWILDWLGLGLTSVSHGGFIAMTILLSIGLAFLGVFGVERSMTKYRFSRTRKPVEVSETRLSSERSGRSK